MARTRKSRAAKAQRETGSPTDLTCPECGKTFTRAASLGAHRNRAHGVTGTSKRRTKATGSAPKPSGSGGRPRRRPTRRTSSTITAPTSRTDQRNGRSLIDRDELLQAIFPNGVPPREDVIRRISDWLDEAEQLAKL